MEKRKTSRTSLISDYNAEFKLGDQAFSRIQVSNIGTSGCCVQLPVASAKYLKNKPLLDNMILFHADAKHYSLKGRVAWHDGGQNPKGQWITAGVEFLETPQECAQEIKEYVMASVKREN